MWIVRLALRRPYTFVVLAILILMLGTLAILSAPKDIFPNIDIPVISVVWSYQGLSAEQMADRIITPNERAMTTTVSDIEHIESESLDSTAVIKVFFYQGANISMALAQMTSISQTLLRQLPPGTTPPLIFSYSASNVPILQMGLSGPGLSEQELYDLGTNFIRTQLANIEGASVPFPYGGKQRQIEVDLNTAALQSKRLSPPDVVNAISAQNLILPSGTAKIGPMEYDVESNGSPAAVERLNGLPIETAGNTVIYIRDVAHVRDGYSPQTNIVRVNGQRSALLTVQKTGDASTLDIISRVKQEMPQIARELPPQLKIQMLSDQSVFVRASITGVVQEWAQYEHAIAALIGKPASVFTLPFSPLSTKPPRVPVGLPSQLLEQRPDVAAAERLVAAANAQIGVAKAAYFPQLLLTASGGFESGNIGTLLEGPAGVWAFGAGALETVFEGGQRHAVSAEARAAYDQAVASYRQTVLTAFQNVEDNLAALRILEQEASTQEVAVQAAERSVVLSLNEYKGGLVDYLQALTAQTAALADQLTAVNILGRQTVATVQLIEAVGGGWDTSKLPSP